MTSQPRIRLEELLVERWAKTDIKRRRFLRKIALVRRDEPTEEN